MRISVDGGSPEKLATLLRSEWVQCGANVDSRCVLTEASREHILVFEFDPARGKGHQLVTLESSSRSVCLAPDGDRLAWHVRGDGGPVRLVVLDLATQERQEIPIADHSTLGQLSWSVEGDCLYAPTGSDEDPAVLRIDLDGTWTEIPANDLLPSGRLLPAPGGSQFVFSKTLRESAIWLIAGLQSYPVLGCEQLSRACALEHGVTRLRARSPRDFSHRSRTDSAAGVDQFLERLSHSSATRPPRPTRKCRPRHSNSRVNEAWTSRGRRRSSCRHRVQKRPRREGYVDNRPSMRAVDAGRTINPIMVRATPPAIPVPPTAAATAR
jgi:hypothetical protein